MTRFRLDADADRLDLAADRLGLAAAGGEQLADGLASLADVASQGRGWHGSAATAWTAEVRALGGVAAATAPLLGAAQAAVAALARDVREAVEVDLRRLDVRWQHADDTFEAAVRSGQPAEDALAARAAERARLDAEQAELRASLRERARQTGRALAGAVLVAAPRHLAHPSRPGVPYAMGVGAFEALVRDHLAARLPGWGAGHEDREAGRADADLLLAALARPGTDAHREALARLATASPHYLEGVAARLGELPGERVGAALAAATSLLARQVSLRAGADRPGLQVEGVDALVGLLDVVALLPGDGAAAWARGLGVDGVLGSPCGSRRWAPRSPARWRTG